MTHVVSTIKMRNVLQLYHSASQNPRARRAVYKFGSFDGWADIVRKMQK